LQCGIRRLIPLEHYEMFFIQHSTNKAQSRRPRYSRRSKRGITDLVNRIEFAHRNELLNARDWKMLVNEKLAMPITMQQYDDMVSITTQ
jgi:hypothetical protein